MEPKTHVHAHNMAANAKRRDARLIFAIAANSRGIMPALLLLTWASKMTGVSAPVSMSPIRPDDTL